MAVKPNTELFRERLIVKLMGKKKAWIEHFCSYIHRLFPPEKITFTPILRDKHKEGYFCFVNILYDRSNPNLKKRAELEKDSAGLPFEEEGD